MVATVSLCILKAAGSPAGYTGTINVSLLEGSLCSTLLNLLYKCTYHTLPGILVTLVYLKIKYS